jgi:guanylate kinase
VETSGDLILATGFYGAGKSTLARTALDALDNLEYLQTITTRQPRQEEIEYGSIEYEFVSPEEYAARRAASRHWDHMHLQEHSYGADVDDVNQKLARGIGIICCTAPDKDVVSQMSNLYAASPVVVWIDTLLELANKRLLASGNERRIGRIHYTVQSEANAAKIKQLASIIFKPTNNPKVDETAFIGTVQSIMGKSHVAST